VSTALDAFNPLGSGSLLSKLLPTALDPVAELATNRNFADKPIVPERSRFEDKIPDSENYFPSVSPVSRRIASGLNAATGGDEVVPGAVSVSPEVMDYLATYFTGGVGRFVESVGNLATAPFDPERDVAFGDIPFARRVVGSKPAWLDKTLFYDRVGQVDETFEDVKDYADRGMADKRAGYAESHADLLKMRGLAVMSRKRMSGLRKERGKLEAAHDANLVDDAAYQERKAALDAREREVIDGFNRRWTGRDAD